MLRGFHILGEIPRGRQESRLQLLYLNTMWGRSEENTFYLASVQICTSLSSSPAHSSQQNIFCPISSRRMRSCLACYMDQNEGGSIKEESYL